MLVVAPSLVREIVPRSRIGYDLLVIADGNFLPAELVVWAAGVKAPDLAPDFLRDIDRLETNRIARQIAHQAALRAQPGCGDGQCPSTPPGIAHEHEKDRP